MVTATVGGKVYKNWAETFSIHPECYFEPETVEELQEIFRQASEGDKKVSFVGNGSSPSDLPCNRDIMICMLKFDKVLEINRQEGYVQAQGGILLGHLIEQLKTEGMALPCLPSISHVSLAGAISTGTHGTGVDQVSLSASTIEVVLCTAKGDILTLSRESDDIKFRAACCSLGYLGAIISLKIKVERSFSLHEQKLPTRLANVLEHYGDYAKANNKYRFMYYPHTGMCVEYLVNATNAPTQERGSFFWDTIVAYYLFQIALLICYFIPWLLPATNRLFFQLLHSQPSQRVNDSHKVMNFNVYFKQFVTEYAFPMDKLKYVMEEFERGIEHRKLKVHFPVEVRFVGNDDVTLSQSNGRKDVAHINLVSFKPFGLACPKAGIWELFEEIMEKVGGRPHWAKLHKCDKRRLSALYGDSLEQFIRVKRELDPKGLFMNDYYKRHFQDDDRTTRVESISYSP